MKKCFLSTSFIHSTYVSWVYRTPDTGKGVRDAGTNKVHIIPALLELTYW